MTDQLRQAAQQALVALEGLFGLPNQWESGGVAVWRLGGSDAPRQAITALRTALEQQAEPVTREGFNVWWDGDYDDSDNRFEKDSAAYWAWAGWQAAQRKELSASEILNMMPSAIPAEYDGPLMEFARAIEAKLKERNT